MLQDHHTYIWVYIYTHTYNYIHTHTHTHTLTLSLQSGLQADISRACPGMSIVPVRTLLIGSGTRICTGLLWPISAPYMNSLTGRRAASDVRCQEDYRDPLLQEISAYSSMHLFRNDWEHDISHVRMCVMYARESGAWSLALCSQPYEHPFRRWKLFSVWKSAMRNLSQQFEDLARCD